jgi:hypothetical protein
MNCWLVADRYLVLDGNRDERRSLHGSCQKSSKNQQGHTARLGGSGVQVIGCAFENAVELLFPYPPHHRSI